jgi:hypothetical protein
MADSMLFGRNGHVFAAKAEMGGQPGDALPAETFLKKGSFLLEVPAPACILIVTFVSVSELVRCLYKVART